MRQTKLIMGMPITVEVLDAGAEPAIAQVFGYFEAVDQKFSTYKNDSEVSKFNAGLVSAEQLSPEFAEVLDLSEQTKQQTQGYFDIFHNGKCDPSGLVKGWAIRNAARLLERHGIKNFYIEAGGDIQTAGKNSQGENWTVGIRNPFDDRQIVKILEIENRGIATSGTSQRGQHIYNPKKSGPILDIISVSVIGPDIYEADRFATAAFAMGKNGIFFLEKLADIEGYMIDKDGIATMTSGLQKYIKANQDA